MEKSRIEANPFAGVQMLRNRYALIIGFASRKNLHKITKLTSTKGYMRAFLTGRVAILLFQRKADKITQRTHL